MRNQSGVIIVPFIIMIAAAFVALGARTYYKKDSKLEQAAIDVVEHQADIIDGDDSD